MLNRGAINTIYSELGIIMDTKTKENSYLIDWLSFTIQTILTGGVRKAVEDF